MGSVGNEEAARDQERWLSEFVRDEREHTAVIQWLRDQGWKSALRFGSIRFHKSGPADLYNHVLHRLNPLSLQNHINHSST